MVSACNSPDSASGVSLHQTPTLVKRQKVCDLLLSGIPGIHDNNSQIARMVGIHRETVIRIRKALSENGVKIAMQDNRTNEHRKKYGNMWARIEAFKAANPSAGGREIRFHLHTEQDVPFEEMPVAGAIDMYFSRKGQVSPKSTAKGDTLPYYQEQYYYRPMARVGMDCQLVADYAGGKQLLVVSVIDFWSRAVYSEAFPWNDSDSYIHGVSPVIFAGCFTRFCTAFGIPEVCVLDNGPGQITQSGWLSEVARIALSFGCRVEWEPQAKPWRNGAVENWHRHSQNWWLDARKRARTTDEARRMWRERAWLYTTKWEQKKLGNKPAASILNQCDKWPIDGPDAGPITLPVTPKCEHEWSGTISVQRMVESAGFVKLHGNDNMRVPEMLVGGYVRIDFHIQPKGEYGTGTVYDGKGRVVMNFSHAFECRRKEGEPLTWDCNAVGYAMEGDIRAAREVAPGSINQQAYNRLVEKAQKNQRASADYAGTNSAPVMHSRKPSSAKKEAKQ